jgi:hypothetical protein
MCVTFFNSNLSMDVSFIGGVFSLKIFYLANVEQNGLNTS